MQREEVYFLNERKSEREREERGQREKESEQERKMAFLLREE